MKTEESIRSALRWHASSVKDAAKSLSLFKDQEAYNKAYIESENMAVEQILKAFKANGSTWVHVGDDK